MSRVFSQNMPTMFSASGALAGSDAGIGGSNAGSMLCNGYARLVGMLQLSASTQSGSGFQVQQSGNGGANWDTYSACNVMAAGASSFSYEITGNAVRVKISNGSSANTYRTNWWLRPI